MYLVGQEKVSPGKEAPMKRMTLWTALGLTLFYGALWLLFAESRPVSCHEVLLSDREAVVTLQNDGAEPVAKVLVVARIYQGEELVAASPLVEKRGLAQGKAQVRLPLPKPLAKGIDYRVVTHVQTAGSRPASREFQARVVKQSAAAWPPARRRQVIDEPYRLRRVITTIDPRAEMGLL